MSYTPPFTITSEILSLVAKISELLGRLSSLPTQESEQQLLLRKVNRMRTIQGSLAIEGNQLSEGQITALLEGKRIVAPAREVLEASNAVAVYEQFDSWDDTKQDSLLAAHKALMLGLIDSAGQYRSGGVGVFDAGKVIHMAPQAELVPRLMNDLFSWLQDSNENALIQSSIFHYEFEFIHPFSDGNGRMGRLWQNLILAKYHPVFAYLPVESLIHQHQQAYYQALQHSTSAADSAPFIHFMLSMIEQALLELQLTSPQVAPQVTPQVKELLLAMHQQALNNSIHGFKRDELQSLLNLSDRKSFTARYIKPALQAGLIVMTLPDKPTSRLQRYRLSDLGRQTILPAA